MTPEEIISAIFDRSFFTSGTLMVAPLDVGLSSITVEKVISTLSSASITLLCLIVWGRVGVRHSGRKIINWGKLKGY